MDNDSDATGWDLAPHARSTAVLDHPAQGGQGTTRAEQAPPPLTTDTGPVATDTASDLTTTGDPTTSDPTDTVGLLDGAALAIRAAADADTTRLTERAIFGSLDALDRISASRDSALIQMVSELIDRGVLSGGIARISDWLTTRCPSLARSHAVDLARLAQATDGPDRVANEPVVRGVLDHHLSARRGSMLLRALGQVRPALDPGTYAADVALLVDAARRRHTFTERDLARILDRLVATAMSAKEHEQRDTAARAMRGVAESSLADGSVIRFIISADSEGAALVRGVLNSPLAAPEPAADGTPDRRSASVRRYDALLAVLRRGMARGDGDGIAAGPPAQIMVTTDYTALLDAVASVHGDTGENRPLGPGFTTTGEMLSPATVRQLACDADIIPAVLGTTGEVLDLGRTRRLASLGQRRALWHRDQGCTIPGCSIPAAWCDAHHIVHWADGGPSDLSNYALLCPRHHTDVHRQHLTAEIEPGAPPGMAVRWLIPDSVGLIRRADE